ncbi:uncharacterized protein LOC144578411 [Callithrix jacchus]
MQTDALSVCFPPRQPPCARACVCGRTWPVPFSSVRGYFWVDDRRSLKTRKQGRRQCGGPGQGSLLTKARIPSDSAPEGHSAVPRRLRLQRVGWRPVKSPDSSRRSRAPAALGAGRAPVGGEDGQPAPGAGVPPAVPPSLLPSLKHHQHQMAKRRSPRRERCAAACGTD